MKYKTDRNTGTMSYRFTFLAVAVVASIVLMGCHTAQKPGSTASEESSATDESSKDTQKVKGITTTGKAKFPANLLRAALSQSCKSG